MLTIAATFLHGTVRAGSPHDIVMAGGRPEPEWPPSPARLFSALVAADGTRGRCRVTYGSELSALEALPPPRIYAEASPQRTDLRPRFVVQDSTVANVMQEYPARTGAEVRPGVRLSLATPVVTWVWEGSLEDQHREALARRAARVGYLGCSDSPVRLDIGVPAPTDLPQWRPGSATGVSLPVPYPGFTRALDHAYDAWTSGDAMRRALVPTRWERYAWDEHRDPAQRAQLVWLELDRPVAGRRALQLTTALRDALLAYADRGGDGGEVGRRAPWQLHGHDVPDGVERPYQLVRFLPLLNVGHERSDGTIHGLGIWLPPGSPDELIEMVRSAVHSGIRRVYAPGVVRNVAPRQGTSRKWATHPARWIGPSAKWFSVTPVVVERGNRRGPSRADVQAWFENAGHPQPGRVRVSPVPTRRGVPRLNGREVHRAGKDRHPFVWVEVEFDEPVEGPLCVGRSRSLGMGLLAPAAPGGAGGRRGSADDR